VFKVYTICHFVSTLYQFVFEGNQATEDAVIANEPLPRTFTLVPANSRDQTNARSETAAHQLIRAIYR
jgi:hypothetical protein